MFFLNFGIMETRTNSTNYYETLFSCRFVQSLRVSMLNKKTLLHKLILYLSAVVLLVPLVVWPTSTYPFIFGKATWLQVGAELIGLLYIFLVVYEWEKYRPRWSWLGVGVLLFYLSLFVSSYFGVDWWRSFWSRAERQLGLFVMIHYGILFLVWRSVLSKEQLYKLWQWFVVTGVFVPLVAMYQLFNSGFLFNVGSARVVTTLGNPTFAAGFMLFLFFSALIFWYRQGSRLKWLWLGVAILSAVGIFITQTRGAIIGWVAGLIVLALWLTANRVYSPRLRKITGACTLGIVALIALAFVARGTVVVKAIPGVSRLVNTPLEAATGGTRLLFWKTSLIGWKEHPVLGWGWENYYDLANKYYLPDLLRYGPEQEWNDNAHNLLINTLAVTGIVGLVVFIFLYGTLIATVYKQGKSVASLLPDHFLWGGLLALLAAHLIQNLFVFENSTSYLFFFFLLALIDRFAHEKQWSEASTVLGANGVYTSRLINALRGVGVVVASIAVVLVIFRFSYLPAKADRYVARAIIKTTTDFAGALEIYKQGLSVEPNVYKDELSFYFARYLTNWLHAHPDFASSDYRRLAFDMYERGAIDLQTYVDRHPTDPRAAHFLATAYIDGYDFWLDPAYLILAERTYQQALPHSPRRQTLLYGLAKAQTMAEKHDAAIKVLEQAINDAPRISDNYWQLALVYESKGDKQKAYEMARKAHDLGYKFSQEGLIIALQLFSEHGAADLIEPEIKNYLNSNLVNKRLVEGYIEYLGKVKRYKEADYWNRKFIENK